jgi:hypothetical protein
LKKVRNGNEIYPEEYDASSVAYADAFVALVWEIGLSVCVS